jgi:hypothetical protein
MKRRDPELVALLERGRVIPRLPDVVHARILARARATVAAGQVLAPDSVPGIQARGRKVWVALAAALCLAVGAAAAVASLRSRVAPPPESASWFDEPEIPPPRIAAPARPRGSSNVPARPTTITRPHRPARPVNLYESYAAELELLQRAQAAYARRDFIGALVLIAEHARWFPMGRLAEERDALRVRSLAGSGRTDEARRAVSVFAERFPRSVLLPRLADAVQTAE